MIGDMLFLDKADNNLIVPQREEIDLGREVWRMLEFYGALAEERGVLLARTGEARISGDRLMLQRALSNLIANALRHASRGGTVSVESTPSITRITVWLPGLPAPAGSSWQPAH